MASMMTMGLVAGGVVAAVVAGIAALIVKELSKPPPKGGSKFTLPNGMEIQHWQKGETEFLYTEIFGKESAYSQDDKILFVPGATVVDAGANIGMFSLFAAKQCKGDATILAFEPIPSTHAVLAANANNLNTGAYQAQFGAGKDAKVSMTAYNKGLSNKPAQVVFEHHPHFSVWSTQDASFAATRLDRIASDLPRAAKTNEHFLVRMLPSFIISFLGRLILNKVGKTEKVPATLVTLSSIIEERNIKQIDVLKVDVEGAEVMVLEGIQEKHWPMVQQVVLEVESFALKDTIINLLAAKNFETSWFASEQERNPGVHSEVCMLYAWRPEYRARHLAKTK